MRADDGLDGMKRFVCTLAIEPDVDGKAPPDQTGVLVLRFAKKRGVSRNAHHPLPTARAHGRPGTHPLDAVITVGLVTGPVGRCSVRLATCRRSQLAPLGSRQRGGARGRRRRPRAGAADQVPRSGGDARGLDDHAPYPSRRQLAHSRTSVTSTARTGPSGGSLRYCGYFSVSSTSARSRSSLWSSTRARPRRRTHQRRPQFSS